MMSREPGIDVHLPGQGNEAMRSDLPCMISTGARIWPGQAVQSNRVVVSNCAFVARHSGR